MCRIFCLNVQLMFLQAAAGLELLLLAAARHHNKLTLTGNRKFNVSGSEFVSRLYFLAFIKLAPLKSLIHDLLAALDCSVT